MVQGLVDRFIGMGIIETGKSYCIIKEMGESSIKEFDHSLRRIFLVILQMFDRVIEATKKDEIKDSSLCKEIHTIDLNIDKFVDYCSRILNKIKTSPFEEKKHFDMIIDTGTMSLQKVIETIIKELEEKKIINDIQREK